ncbi:cell division protein SepF [Agathobacter sp.]
MSFIDKILDKMSLNPEDDEEFDNEDYYLDEEEEEEELPRKPFRRKEKEKIEEEPAPKAKPAKSSSSKITPISKSSRKQVSSEMEVCVIKPSSIEDEIEITDTLLNGRTVVINMEGLNVDTAQRIIDFTSGSAYALHGNLQKISNFIFIATPHGVDISGDIQNLMESFDIPGASY